MLSKEIKTPLIVGTILYGIALLIDLASVILQKTIIQLYINDTRALTGFVFPFISINQIIVMLMYIVFLIIMLKYKGNSRKNVGIAIVAVYCIIDIVIPYLSNYSKILNAQFIGPDYFAASNALNNFIGMITNPFTTVSVVLVIIAIGRYIISTPDNE